MVEEVAVGKQFEDGATGAPYFGLLGEWSGARTMKGALDFTVVFSLGRNASPKSPRTILAFSAVISSLGTPSHTGTTRCEGMPYGRGSIDPFTWRTGFKTGSPYVEYDRSINSFFTVGCQYGIISKWISLEQVTYCHGDSRVGGHTWWPIWPGRREIDQYLVKRIETWFQVSRQYGYTLLALWRDIGASHFDQR